MSDYYSRLLGLLRRHFKNEPVCPFITEQSGKLSIDHNKPVFVVICGPNFDMRIPNAGTTSRLGWCHGFEEIGIPYVLVSIYRLKDDLLRIPNAICWISGDDYQYLDAANFNALKKTNHFVWVSTWFKGNTEFYRKNDLPCFSHSQHLNEKILSSTPDFVFTISPESSFEFYEMWVKSNVKLISLPLACDRSVYANSRIRLPQFQDVKMAFVGGYWPYKAIQLDRYLMPYQGILTVFGYSQWPYAGYGGQIAVEHEPALYRQARLSPTINEPHVEKMGVDLNERVFKVLGSGGITVTDAVPGYREWFSDSELLVPHNLDEYREMVHEILTNDEVRQRYAEAGNKAVLSRHMYCHRARTAISHLRGFSETAKILE